MLLEASAPEMLFPIPARSPGQSFVAGLYQQQIIATSMPIQLASGNWERWGAEGQRALAFA